MLKNIMLCFCFMLIAETSASRQRGNTRKDELKSEVSKQFPFPTELGQVHTAIGNAQPRPLAKASIIKSKDIESKDIEYVELTMGDKLIVKIKKDALDKAVEKAKKLETNHSIALDSWEIVDKKDKKKKGSLSIQKYPNGLIVIALEGVL